MILFFYPHWSSTVRIQSHVYSPKHPELLGYSPLYLHHHVYSGTIPQTISLSHFQVHYIPSQLVSDLISWLKGLDLWELNISRYMNPEDIPIPCVKVPLFLIIAMSLAYWGLPWWSSFHAERVCLAIQRMRALIPGQGTKIPLRSKYAVEQLKPARHN